MLRVRLAEAARHGDPRTGDDSPRTHVLTNKDWSIRIGTDALD
jgi:hypothetical protein